MTRSDYWQILIDELGSKERAEKFTEIWAGRDLDLTDCGFGDTPEDNKFTRMRTRMDRTFGKQKVDEVLARFQKLLEDRDERAQTKDPS